MNFFFEDFSVCADAWETRWQKKKRLDNELCVVKRFAKFYGSLRIDGAIFNITEDPKSYY